MAACLGILFIRLLYPFLAVTAPLRGGVLVVEGWACDYTLNAAIQEFQKGGYEKIYVLGGPIERGAALYSYGSFAEVGAASLRAAGVPVASVQPVPAPSVRQDRTYTSGRALYRWWEVKGGAPSQVHLFSEGAHARRSRLLLERALGKHVRVGVTSVPQQSFDERRWWTSSAGFRTVTSEALAYVYARLVFHP